MVSVASFDGEKHCSEYPTYSVSVSVMNLIQPYFDIATARIAAAMPLPEWLR